MREKEMILVFFRSREKEKKRVCVKYGKKMIILEQFSYSLGNYCIKSKSHCVCFFLCLYPYVFVISFISKTFFCL